MSENGEKNGEQKKPEVWNPESGETFEEYKERTKQKTTLNIKVENRTSHEQQKLWMKMKEKLSEKLSEEGIPLKPDDITSSDDMDRYAKIHSELVKRKKETQNVASGQKIATGQTPLSAEQLGRAEYYPTDVDVSMREYPDEEAMIEDLKAEASQGNEDAKKYLQRLMKKQMSQDIQHGVQYEFQGKLKDFRQEVSPTASEEEEEEVSEEISKGKKKWRKVK